MTIQFNVRRRNVLKVCAAVAASMATACGGGSGTNPTPSGPTAPRILRHPADQQVLLGQDVMFSVAATGTAPLTYEWMRNGMAILGATTDTLVLADMASFEDGDIFMVTVRNSAGYIRSESALLNVIRPRFSVDTTLVSVDSSNVNIAAIYVE